MGERCVFVEARRVEGEADGGGEDDEDEGFGEDAAEDEDLEQALKTMKTREDGLPVAPVEAAPRSAITRRPEVLDDFIRNVLLKMGMVSAAREV